MGKLQNKPFLSIGILLVFSNFLLAQITNDCIKIKLSAGFYGLTSPTTKYTEEYNFDKSLNYSLGLEKDFKLGKSDNWILRSEILYGRTNIRVGFDYINVVNGPKDHFKLDQILLPIKLGFVKNKFAIFVGLINNFNFETQVKEYGKKYFESVGTFNFREDENTLLYERNSVDKKYSIQYVAGLEFSGTKRITFG